MHPTSYVLPIKLNNPPRDELIQYVNGLSAICDVIVVDGSDEVTFGNFASRCAIGVRHVAPHSDLCGMLNGKVAGVITGLRLASHERLVIADDDVRYDAHSLAAVSAALDDAEVVRPQNYFEPQPWHAQLDTARTLINRASGGDWPGTLAVRRSVLQQTGGYDGGVIFENLEMVRTVIAAGGRERVRLDLFVRRLPPSAGHFVSQRVRQAYDELTRPGRMFVWLSVLPALGVIARRRGVRAAVAFGLLPVVVAETGRRRAGGTRVFPLSASLLAPVWLLERGVSAWLALGARVLLGGIPYRGGVVQRAATPMPELRQRHGSADVARHTRTGD